MWPPPIKLGSFVREWCKNKEQCYVFLDEIQRVYKIINPVLTNGEMVVAKEESHTWSLLSALSLTLYMIIFG